MLGAGKLVSDAQRMSSLWNFQKLFHFDGPFILEESVYCTVGV